MKEELEGTWIRLNLKAQHKRKLGVTLWLSTTNLSSNAAVFDSRTVQWSWTMNRGAIQDDRSFMTL